MQRDIYWLMDKVGLNNQPTGRTKMRMGFMYYSCHGLCRLSLLFCHLSFPMSDSPLPLAFVSQSLFCCQISERVWLRFPVSV